MPDVDVGSQLQALFQETREAHHEAFDEVDGADPDWPMWYAERMHRRLGTLLRADFTQSELVYLLVLADRERATRAPGAEWTEFYARFFLERYGGA